MTLLERLVEMVRELSPEEFDAFAASVDDLRAERWDRQIEDDSAKGTLDALISDRAGITRGGANAPL